MPEVLWWVRVQPGVLVPAQAWSVSLAQPLPPLSLLDKRPPSPRAPVRTQKSARAAGRYFAVGRGDLLCSPAPVPSQPSPTATVPRESVQVGTASPAGRDSRLPVLLQPSPGCPRVIWPRGLPAHLRVPLPLLVFTTSPRALPLPENLPAARPCSGWPPRALVPSAVASFGAHCWHSWAHLRARASQALRRFQRAHPGWVPAAGAGAARCHLVLPLGPTVGPLGCCRFQGFREIPLSLRLHCSHSPHHQD